MKQAARLLALTICIFGMAAAQRSGEPVANKLQLFERDWLTAYLNNERVWITRFSAGKMDVVPASGIAIDGRADAVSALIRSDLPANEIKVRISGTISFLTNDPNLNLSFNFLDTFNKVDGKWRVIASSHSPAPANGLQQAESVLRRLENELAQAVATGDLATLERLTAPEFVSTGSNGQLEDRGSWVAAKKGQSNGAAGLREMKVNLTGDNVAVVTGIRTSAGLQGDRNEISVTGRFTHTWAKTGGRWQCIAAHFTRLR